MKHGLAVATLALVSLFLPSCNIRHDVKPPEPQGDNKKPVEPNGVPVAQGATRVSVAEGKDGFVYIDFWENGKPSERFRRVEHRLIGGGGALAIQLHEAENDGKTRYDIQIGDGLGMSSNFFDLPAGLTHFVSPLPKELAAKPGEPIQFAYVCIGKDCKPKANESAEALVRRMEFAFVLSIGEAAKE